MRWRCTVCGYRSDGPEPPEKCPVCGADRAKFVSLEDEGGEGAHGVEEGDAQEGEKEGGKESGTQVETDSSPPRAPLEPAVEKEGAAPEKKKGAVEGFLFLRELMVKGRAHPILVHIPNGVLPVAVLLLFLGLVFSHEGLVQAAYYNLVVVVVSIPLVFFAGWLDWQAHFDGVYTNLIVTKIASAVIAFVLGVVLVLWKSFSSSSGWPFFLLHLVMLAATGVAGYMGGKLVFEKRE